MNSYTFMKDKNFSKGRYYLGASDALTLSGQNPHQTPYELWEVLTGRADAWGGNRRTDAGHKQEPGILGNYISKSTGKDYLYNKFIISRMKEQNKFKQYRSYTEFVYPENKRIMCHPDLLDLSGKEPLLVQAKNRGIFSAKRKDDPNFGYDPDDFSSNGIPICDYLQEQVEMMCSGISQAYVSVQVEGWDNRIYGPVDYHKKTAESLLALYLRMLWHIDKDEPPTPQSWGDVVKLFPNFKKNTKSVVSDEAELECRQMKKELGDIGLKMKKLELRKTDIKNALGLFLGENNYLETPDGFSLASASVVKGRESISVSELKKFPELYEKVAEAGLINTSSEYRQLYVKGTPVGNIDTYTLLTTDDGTIWKRSRKKYTADEKKSISALLESLKFEYKWEKV